MDPIRLIRPTPPAAPRPDPAWRTTARERQAARRQAEADGRLHVQRFAEVDARAIGLSTTSAPEYRDAVEIVEARDLRLLGVRLTPQKGRRAVPRTWWSAKDGTGYSLIVEVPRVAIDDLQRVGEVLIHDVEIVKGVAMEASPGKRIPAVDERRDHYYRCRFWPAGSWEAAD